ncbi:MAG: hypothetical protein IJ086_02940 [Clostridium sp.]|nr:hypothetical protein [Clostridium sp.]
MKKILNFKNNILLATCIIGLFVGVNTSYASNSVTIKNESPVLINESSSANTNGESRIISNTTINGDGSLKKAEDYVQSKLFDVVGFFQSFIKPLTYITFILSAIGILVGLIFDSGRSKMGGLLGMIFSILVYVSVVFAPQIVEYFGSWLAM